MIFSQRREEGCTGWRFPGWPDRAHEWVQADKRATALTHLAQHNFQIAKIADPPVTFRTQGIKLYAAPQSFSFQQRLRFIAALWGDN
jgi:hypothetical protein